MARTPVLADLGHERFVSLTTFRRSGEPVPTPVWVLPDGRALVVSTPADAAKLKRIRNDPRVTLQPCDRRGKVDPMAPLVEGTAEIITDSAASEAVSRRLQGKYGLEFRIFSIVEWVLRWGNSDRVVLRITPNA
jgi:PPOX class probable F420-dependent enzyme